MLNTVFKDAIINREKTLSILKGPEYEKIIQKAKDTHHDRYDSISFGLITVFFIQYFL